MLKDTNSKAQDIQEGLSDYEDERIIEEELELECEANRWRNDMADKVNMIELQEELLQYINFDRDN